MMCRGKLLRFMCASVAFVVVGCNGDHVDDLVGQLKDGDTNTRRAAALALKQFSGDRTQAIPTLADAALGDADVQVRKLSLQALGTIGAPARSHIADLAPALEDDEESLRIVAAIAIARIDPTSEAGREQLVKAMQGGNGRVLLEIGRLGPDAAWATPTLTRLLSHELVQVRSLAAHTLGEIGPSAVQAATALERMSQERDGAVRAVALDALNKVQAKPAGDN